MNTVSTPIPLLQNKRAVIFGAGGAVGMAVAKEFAAQGATVFLSGRRLAAISQVAASIHQDSGVASAAEVDALDEQAVNTYLDRVAQEGSIDILLNAVGPQPKDYGNGSNTLELPLEQFLLPLSTLVPSQFITARAAARHMVRQHSGVILFVTAGLQMTKTPNVTAIGAAFGAMEALVRCLATDLGPAGVRVVGIRSGAMVETRTIQQGIERVVNTMGVTPAQVVAQFEQATLLRRLSTAADTARVAAFLASDGARTMTGALVNASSGRIID
jgi:NAD(P)-dependent dehydrogenase (short-subunit alcohol dehydrogenase family)